MTSLANPKSAEERKSSSIDEDEDFDFPEAAFENRGPRQSVAYVIDKQEP